MDDRAFNYLIGQKISVFYGRKDPVPKHSVSVLSILKAIQNGKWKDLIEWLDQETDETERAEIKGRFPAVTFSGTFTHRKVNNLIDYTHLLVIDLDKKHINMPYDKAFKYIIESPFVVAAFRSPSGGIKALAYSKIKRERHNNLFFPCIEDYFMRNFGIRLDPSGKDVSRLCFISYDPKLYMSGKDKRPFNAKEDSPDMYKALNDNFVEVREIDYSKYEGSTNIKHVFEKASEWAEKSTGGFRKGSKNNYIYYLACIMNRAGVYESDTFRVILDRYPSLVKEVKNNKLSTVDSAYKHHKHEFGIRPILERKKTDQNKLNL